MSALGVAKLKLLVANLLDDYSKSSLSAKNKFSGRQAFLGSGIVVLGAIITIYKKIQFNKVKKEREIVTTTKTTPTTKQNKVKVDKTFFKRLRDILKIIVPSWKSTEALHLVILTILLYSRTLLRYAPIAPNTLLKCHIIIVILMIGLSKRVQLIDVLTDL